MIKDRLRYYFNNKKIVKHESLLRFEVDTWRLSWFITKKILPVAGYHPYPLDELMLMTGAVAYFQPTHIFDWGTYVGKSARIFYETVKFYKLDTEIHSIDLPDDVSHVEHPGKNRGRLVRGKKGVFLHQGDGVTLAVGLFDYRAKFIKPLFFVDGDHSYASVSRELAMIKKHFPQAQILVHDTFYQSPEANYNIGPYQAVQELVADGYAAISTNLGLPGMTLLYKQDK